MLYNRAMGRAQMSEDIRGCQARMICRNVDQLLPSCVFTNDVCYKKRRNSRSAMRENLLTGLSCIRLSCFSVLDSFLTRAARKLAQCTAHCVYVCIYVYACSYGEALHRCTRMQYAQRSCGTDMHGFCKPATKRQWRITLARQKKYLMINCTNVRFIIIMEHLQYFIDTQLKSSRL